MEHLFLVATGLDSSLVGETEIVGQMRAALQLSRDLGINGPAHGVGLRGGLENGQAGTSRDLASEPGSCRSPRSPFSTPGTSSAAPRQRSVSWVSRR